VSAELTDGGGEEDAMGENISSIAVDRSSIVSLRELDNSSARMVTDLCVSALQTPYVATNQKSLIDAKGNPGSWTRAIYADETPVGFVLLFMPFLPGAIERPQIQPDQIALWRFMINIRFQRMGFGHQALLLVRDECKSHSEVREILSSYVPGLHGPEEFYLSHGFAKTGRLRNGGTEIEIALSLD
jgi:diamine N-acetyltransferase